MRSVARALLKQRSWGGWRATAAAPAAKPAFCSASTEQPPPPPPPPPHSSMTEEQLAALFDDDLQQRLAAAAEAHAVPSSCSAATTVGAVPGSSEQHQLEQQQLPAAASDDEPGTSGHVTPPPSAVAEQPPLWGSFAAAAGGGGWSPLLSSDPWSPVPSPVHARQRLPQRLLQLLQESGVSASAAAAAVAQASDPKSQHPSASSSSSSSTGGGRTEAQQARDAHRLGRRLFDPAIATELQSAGASAASGRTSPHQRQQHQQRDCLSVLSRLRMQHLVQLLDDCQVPSYGSKAVLLQRLRLLLQQQQQGPQQGEQGLAADGTAQPDPAQPTAAGYDGRGRNSRMQTRQGQHRGTQQQRLLESVVDVQQIGSWLLAARAQDVTLIDTRGQAGLQHSHVIVATGLNQRHTRALADAVAWQLRQAAKDRLLEAQQHQQHQQQEAASAPQTGGGDDAVLRRALPPLHVLGDPASEWCVLDAGRVVLHVLTERARRFYALEELLGGGGGGGGARRSRAAANITVLRSTQPASSTKDTIGAPRAAAV